MGGWREEMECPDTSLTLARRQCHLTNRRGAGAELAPQLSPAGGQERVACHLPAH